MPVPIHPAPCPRSCSLSGLCGGPKEAWPAPLSGCPQTNRVGTTGPQGDFGLFIPQDRENPIFLLPGMPTALPYFLRLKSKVLYIILPYFTWLLLPPVLGAHCPGMSPLLARLLDERTSAEFRLLAQRRHLMHTGQRCLKMRKTSEGGNWRRGEAISKAPGQGIRVVWGSGEPFLAQEKLGTLLRASSSERKVGPGV